MKKRGTELALATFLIATIGFGAGTVYAYEVGVEWTGDYGIFYDDPDEGLIYLSSIPFSGKDATGFYNKLVADGWSGKFNYYNLSAWEEDFKKESLGGTDYIYADAVDFAYYVGHGLPTGFYFNNDHDDKKLRCTDTHHDAEWGDLDLEWIALRSCQILSNRSYPGAWYERWAFDVFKGLHQILGFYTDTASKPNYGEIFAYYMIDLEYTIREAWFKAAKDTQPSGVIAAVLGVEDSGYSTWDDHLWGHGSVAPDKSDPMHFFRALYVV